MTAPLILIADAARPARAALGHELAYSGYATIAVDSGQQLLGLIEQLQPKLLLLADTLPDQSGMDILREIRRWSIIPVIMLLEEEEGQRPLQLLDLGADGYMFKPLKLRELLARVQALLRRSAWEQHQYIDEVRRIGPLEISARHLVRLVEAGSKPVALTPTEYRLLMELAMNPHLVLPHQELLKRVWGPQYCDAVEYLRTYINRLRRKLEANPAKPRYLLTEPGVGYRFNPLPARG